MIEPKVRITYQKKNVKRRGRGFSRKELNASGLNIDDALWIGLPVDMMRKSLHDENVEALVSIMSQLEGPEEEATTPKKKPIAKKAPKSKAKPEEISIPLEKIPGIGPKTAERLKEAGYNYISDICKADIEALTKVKGISKKSATDLVEKAKGI